MQRDGHKKNGKNGTDSGDSFTQKNPVFTTLVIEEELTFDNFLKEFFKSSGNLVLRAASALEALAQVRLHWPDLILLNREMSGSNGLKFLPELLQEHPSAAVILMATNPKVPDVVEAMKQGAVDFLERPLDAQRLNKAIEEQKALYKLL
jgi:DNA-binding NtrC family response regulator